MSWKPGDRPAKSASMVRVDQAGEYGATRIYAGQLAVMGHRSAMAREIAGMALILGIDRFMSECRALTNFVGNAVATAIKPLTDAHEALANSQKTKDEAELTELRGKIVKANLLDEAAAGELTLNAARALAKQAEPKHAAPLANSGFTPRTGENKGHVAPKAVK